MWCRVPCVRTNGAARPKSGHLMVGERMCEGV